MRDGDVPLDIILVNTDKKGGEDPRGKEGVVVGTSRQLESFINDLLIRESTDETHTPKELMVLKFRTE